MRSFSQKIAKRRLKFVSSMAWDITENPAKRRKIELNSRSVQTSPNTSAKLDDVDRSLSPYRLSREPTLIDLNHNSILAIMCQLNLFDLANFGSACVFLKALAESSFTESHRGMLDLCGDQFTCRTREQCHTVLQSFGGLCKSILIDMSTFEDDFNSSTAFKWISKYCAASVDTLAMMNFQLDLQSDGDPNTTAFLSNVAQLVLVKCDLANSAVLFEAGASTLESVILTKTEMDAITTRGIQKLSALRRLIVRYCNLKEFTPEKILGNNPDLEHIQLYTKTPLPLTAFDQLTLNSLSFLSFTVNPSFGMENADSALVHIGGLKKLEYLDLSGHKRLEIQPLINRLASHEKLAALELSSVRVDGAVFEQLLHFRQLQVLKLEMTLSTEDLPNYMPYINRLAAKDLRELHIVFDHPIAVDNLVMKFVIMQALHTTDVRRVYSQDEAMEMLNNVDQDQLHEENIIIVWSNGIVWRKFDLAH